MRPIATRPAAAHRPTETVLRSLARAFGLARRAMAPHFARHVLAHPRIGLKTAAVHATTTPSPTAVEPIEPVDAIADAPVA